MATAIIVKDNGKKGTTMVVPSGGFGRPPRPRDGTGRLAGTPLCPKTKG